MKKALLVFSLFFILKIGYSQSPDYNTNEVSIGIIDLTESPKNQEVLFENSYYLKPFSNLTYKRFLNDRNAIRLTFYRPINKSYDKSGGSLINKGEYKEQVMKIGYEYVFKQKRLTPYLAIDFSYIKSKSLRETGGGIAGSFSETKRDLNGFGLSPTVGVNYNFYKNIFIGLESNLNVINLKEEKTLTQSTLLPEPNGSITKETDKSFESIYNPIVFLVKFKF
ncbi:hypothetical protein JM83_2951 [Gillisia sp. Hel_I_86]|uniref:autotransporter outer membrane beta-barrel domain-containing protein n=1 Tax=Gillisia sp. Hel_I_86 TaxID=1249981 RepID=UPI00119B3BCC|nr:autotransporter outer membrane beta-barrel domain-containing protein [Gillisia sp. Hel_I_86]TVZ27880.1 hypothetical protein JM83_2951 [Gillisia sp. Hel_I_86]